MHTNTRKDSCGSGGIISASSTGGLHIANACYGTFDKEQFAIDLAFYSVGTGFDIAAGKGAYTGIYNLGVWGHKNGLII